MRELLVLIQKELLELWRTKKLMITAIIFLFIAVSSPILAKLTPELLKSVSVPGLTIHLPAPTYNDSLDQFIKNISQIALLVLVFVVAGSISDEKTKKTLEIVLTKPISKTKFILSKFVATFASISAIYFLSAIIFYFYTFTTFSGFSFVNFLLMSALVLIYILMIISVTLLASTLVSNAILAGGIGFISYILFGTIFGLIQSVKKYSPNLVFSNYKEIVSKGWVSDLNVPTLVILSIILFCVISSMVIFKRQEIER